MSASPTLTVVGAMNVKDDLRSTTPRKQSRHSDDPTDSGYSSQSITPVSDTSNHTERLKSRGPPIPFNIPIKTTPFFDIELPQSAIEQFLTIQPHFERLLLDHIRKSEKPGAKYKPMSARLVMFGRARAEAVPRIVIFCQPGQEHTIKKFVRQDVVTAICQPNETGEFRFNITVIPNAPRLRGHRQKLDGCVVAGKSLRQAHTMCGLRISLQRMEQSSVATCGGLIKVVMDDGTELCLGITARHPIDDFWHSTNEGNIGTHAESTTPGLADIHPDDLSDDSDIDLGPFGIPPPAKFLLPQIPTTSQEFDDPYLVGEIMGPANPAGAAKNYDWTLFKPNDYLKNKVPSNPMAEISLSRKTPGRTGNRQILLILNETVKRGTLLSSPGRILIGRGEEFVDTFMITISGSEEICDGDSGAWVVDASTFELFGHLVATDMFRAGYVVPMSHIFDDIKRHFSAREVGLPNAVDLTLSKAADPRLNPFRTPPASVSQIAESIDSGYGSVLPSHYTSPKRTKMSNRRMSEEVFD